MSGKYAQDMTADEAAEAAIERWGLECAICHAEVVIDTSHEFYGFKDIKSLREYKISGMCQECQDSIFTMEEEDDGDYDDDAVDGVC